MNRTLLTTIPDHSPDQTTLESLIDRYGLACVTETLALIASAKADHIRENWQDEPLAETWDTAAAAALRAAVAITKIGL